MNQNVCFPKTHTLHTTELNAADVPVIAANRITTPEMAEELLEDGACDMVSLARPLLADEKWVSKALAGASEDINPCIAWYVSSRRDGPLLV
jgi:2,4-dienoyl-CoA reductase-like NADH-dependent reductase (Old Yellow Enzyme family)